MKWPQKVYFGPVFFTDLVDASQILLAPTPRRSLIASSFRSRLGGKSCSWTIQDDRSHQNDGSEPHQGPAVYDAEVWPRMPRGYEIVQDTLATGCFVVGTLSLC